MKYTQILLLALAISGVFSVDIDNIDVQQHLNEQDELRNQVLSYLSYDQIVETFYDLEKKYPHYIKVYDAVQQFNNKTLPETKCFYNNNPRRVCQFVYAVLTNFSDPRHVNFTQSFFSGNFHGDEVMGPNVLTYMTKYILEKPVLKLLSKSYIVVLPMSNPSGYFYKIREEVQDRIQIDLNRDFPYDAKENECFKTAGARIINYIWQRHLFTASITFHGGMTAIGWPWGSRNHAYSKYNGHLSPDQNAFFALGKRMSEIADSATYYPRYHEVVIYKNCNQKNIKISQIQYPFNTLTNAIYAIGGSFEDWSYAASWEHAFNRTTIPRCQGISDEEQFMNDNIARSLTYLIETTEDKIPLDSSYGKWMEIHNPSKGIGHVSRNVRLTLDFINNLSPSHNIVASSQKNYNFNVKWELEGCEQIQSTKLLLREKNSQISNITHNNYYSLQELLDDGFKLIQEFSSYPGKLSNSNPEKTFMIEFEQQIERTIDIALVTSCDSKWIEEVKEAKPTLEPQTHFVRSRLNETYLVENNGFYLKSKKYIIEAKGPYLVQNITVSGAVNSAYSESAGSFEYLYIFFGILIVGSIGSYFIYKKFNSLGRNKINFEEIHDEDHLQRSSQSQQSPNNQKQLELQAKKEVDDEAL